MTDFWDKKPGGNLPHVNMQADIDIKLGTKKSVQAPVASSIPMEEGDLLVQAVETNKKAYKAIESAKAATLAAQTVIASAKLNATNNQPLSSPKVEALKGAIEAANYALEVQKDAFEAAKNAVIQAEKEALEAQKEADVSWKELEKIKRVALKALESAQTAQAAAQVAADTAEMESNKAMATKAAMIAAQALEEEATEIKEQTLTRIEQAKQIAQKAENRLFLVENMVRFTKEEAGKIIPEMREIVPPIAENTVVKQEVVVPKQEVLSEAEQMAETLMRNLAQAEGSDLLQEEDTESVVQTVSPEPVKEDLVATETAPLSVAADDVAEDNTGSMWQDQQQKPKEKSFWKTAFSFILLIVVAVGIAILIRTFVFEITLVDGISMEPTLQTGNYLYTSKVNYYFNEPQRGDIIVLEAPDRAGEHYIKRIIGLPGDRVVIKDGQIYINDAQIVERYLSEGTVTNGDIDTIVADGYYFVAGDNREHSHDSRSDSVGAISREAIKGKTLLRLYPFDEFGQLQ